MLFCGRGMFLRKNVFLVWQEKNNFFCGKCEFLRENGSFLGEKIGFFGEN
jgi:hypothetical protein